MTPINPNQECCDCDQSGDAHDKIDHLLPAKILAHNPGIGNPTLVANRLGRPLCIRAREPESR